MLTSLRGWLIRLGAWPTADSRRPDPAGDGRVEDLDDRVILANDLRNLLTVMVRSVESARTHVEQGRGVIADFLEFEQIAHRADRIILRLMSGEPAARPVRLPLDVNLTCAECQGLLLRAVGATVQLKVHLTASRVLVRAERAEIERILLNLALSARHAMPEGGVLTIQTSSVSEVPQGLKHPYVRAKSYVRIAVSDTGPGMPSGTKARVLDASRLRKNHGTELGLASVAHTVRALDGALHIESDGGFGTHVTVDLPSVERPDEDAG